MDSQASRTLQSKWVVAGFCLYISSEGCLAVSVFPISSPIPQRLLAWPASVAGGCRGGGEEEGVPHHHLFTQWQVRSPGCPGSKEPSFVLQPQCPIRSCTPLGQHNKRYLSDSVLSSSEISSSVLRMFLTCSTFLAGTSA